MKIKSLSGIVFLLTALVATGFIYSEKTAIILPVTAPDTYQIDTLATDLRVPWQIAFLPDRSMLFTERPGRVRIYRNGKLMVKPIFTVADVKAQVKMGLLGLCVHPEFATNHFIYLANNYSENNRMKLRVTRYIFRNDTLINPHLILENIPANQNHTGCRLLFGPDKKMYVTTGDADQPVLAQDLKAYNGKILRLNDDGSIPADNPFVNNDTSRKEIWSYGHRNTQGLSFQPGTGLLFNTEHGPTGGDEVNIITKGMNYGWPVIHHRNIQTGMISPLLEYTPSIGPSESVFYNSKAFPELRGNLLVACLRGEEIMRIQLDKQKVVSQQLLFKNQFGRIRSLVVGPDGYLYLSTSHYDPPEGTGISPFDMILRIRPAPGKRSMVTTKAIAINPKSKVVKLTTATLFQQLCASCHGTRLSGTERVKSLASGNFNYGSDRNSIIKNITMGIPEKGMPAWSGAISKLEIEKLADYIQTIAKKHNKL